MNATSQKRPRGPVPRRYFRPLYFLAGAVLVWLLGVGAGFAHLLHYDNTPGAEGASRPCWPANRALKLDPARANLVVAAHPRCPCTRATFEALDRILAHCRGRVTVQVLFYRPHGAAENWEKTDLWDRAAAMPDVQVVRDDDGELANLFGVATSGHVLLYAPDGRRLFSGGITDSRGHAGDSVGADAILALLNTDASAPRETPIFGCPLNNPSLPPGGGQ